MMHTSEFEKLKIELSVKAKNGVDFTLAGSVVWLVIAYVWSQEFSPYNKSVLTFIVGSILLPLAFAFSKLLKTKWTVKDNPLQPLGLWLNFAQLFYFPFLIFVLIKMPDYFIMTYAIITGAHFFPYAWYYKSITYAVGAGIVSVSSLVLGLINSHEKMYMIPIWMSISLLVISLANYILYKKRALNLTSSQ